eukprot:7387674-Prymnesium_polylepis.2
MIRVGLGAGPGADVQTCATVECRVVIVRAENSCFNLALRLMNKPSFPIFRNAKNHKALQNSDVIQRDERPTCKRKTRST